ncbi:hypothetical protein EOD10_12585 [Mesorhizobium sp. M7A.T.Ca.TU.009.01.3.2]|jgi:hypothetical protein|uniref:hypothetical protein n=1 Tax=Mesorhizobium TaxID=68287 RepID=UPI000FCA3092|nr:MULTISPECIES: hypothetical protein [Mesorhizobium]RUU15177.1 hypothetical protein EOD10_12585 [Mesorhizobium sp. M7A.T.Ca.TU.009.01.3.2]RUU64431.1 hypothetical protein EOC99_12350 [Mesorhizobium sp. M7A.T.Ca.TU.009.01.1.1]RUU88731.1 hypothetical protein EOD03_04335 [Mesorhizobium sp. M7A.T.Ca.TU.009.01.1.2]RUV09759.1 hypothetical protein EOD00_14550 [Mesorhizobium sp. M7A.T.Ca.TU.009.01.3.1]RUV50198.1 hypothetical protein EOB77_16285 [Mesorhizobium sp. M7A.F.Ca.MR.228.00.0.0]RVB40710.1 hyp
MTAFLRNTLLAALAVSSMAGSAMAEQTTSCSKTNLNDLWAGRCCGDAGASGCLGGGNNGHGGNGDHGRGGNGGTAGKK